MYQKYREDNGFTLLELIISLTILTVIVVLTFATIRIGMKAWEKGDEKTEFLYRMKYLVNLLDKEISSILPYYFFENDESKDTILAFQGLQNSIRFISSLDSNDPSISAGGLREVSFYLESNEENKEKRLIMTEGVIRPDQSFGKINQNKVRSIILSTDVSKLKFKYYKLKRDYNYKKNAYVGEWLDNYTHGKETSNNTKLPRAIEVTLTMETKKKGIDKAIETFYLPPLIVLLNSGLEFILMKKEKSP